MKSSTFQIVVTGAFIFFLIMGVLLFSGLIKIGGKKAQTEGSGTVVLWGTIDKQDLNEFIEALNFSTDNAYTVSYVEKREETFDSELVEALASGKGPDLFLLPESSILRHKDRVIEYPYQSFPERTFKDLFISEANLYLSDTGVLALPLTVDPLVLYYNQDILESEGISRPPVYWEDLIAMAPKLTKKDSSGNPIKSTIALGTFENTNHAKSIIANLFFQIGNPIVSNIKGVPTNTFYDSRNAKASEAAMAFYTDFSNPQRQVYSWNRSKPSAIESFIAGDSVFYIGRASELFSIESANPNLRFDVSKIPQAKGQGTLQSTNGRMMAVAVSKASKNLNTAYIAAKKMADKEFSEKISAALSIPSARRDLLSVKPEKNPYISVFYDSALIARGWLDPNPAKTDEIFSSMIANINSGRTPIGSAISNASSQIDSLIVTE